MQENCVREREREKKKRRRVRFEERGPARQMDKVVAARECYACPCLNVKIVIGVVDDESDEQFNTIDGLLEETITISPGTETRITVVSL